MIPLTHGLNNKQVEAVLHTEGPLLVLAGAGTGKTKVLTTRVAYIIREELASPQNIMAVTFTNKAAKEMKARLNFLLNPQDSEAPYTPVETMWMGTFHSLATRLLRYHPELVGLSPNFTILDTDDQLRLCKELIRTRGIDEKKNPPRALVNIISRWKDNAWQPCDVPKREGYHFDGHAIHLYGEYQARLTANNACDFGDLLLKALLLFKENHDLLAKYQNWFKYVLVDEYQDTNTVQYQWIRLLTMAHKNICVVGDDDQSIYAWRGAQVGNILRFEQDFPGCKTVKLEQNYRSTGNILRAAGGVIENNRERHDKTLWSEGSNGAPVELHPVWDGKDEARFVSRRIQKEIDLGTPFPAHAILLRTAAQTRPFEEQFMKDAVPYQIVGGLKFYERKEIRDAVAYLRLVLSEKDSLAFERIINTPRRGIGDTALDSVKGIARERDLPLLAATRVGFAEGLLGRAASKFKIFIDIIDNLREKIEETTPEGLMELILARSGYMQMLKDDKNKEEAATRQENLKELLRALKDYDDILSFLEHVSLVTDTEEDFEDAVKLTTVHAAKGLEFETVFIPGFEEGLFPHQRSLNEEGAKGLEEERRLAYVAMTRAKRQLILSYASSRYMYGHFEGVMPSRFLNEIPEDCVKTVKVVGQSGPSRSPWVSSSYNSSPYGNNYKKATHHKPSKPLFTEEEISPNSGNFPIGSRIFHQKFGYGRVQKIEGKGANEKLTIAFEKAGEKKLLVAFANLEKA